MEDSIDNHPERAYVDDKKAYFEGRDFEITLFTLFNLSHLCDSMYLLTITYYFSSWSSVKFDDVLSLWIDLRPGNPGSRR